MEKECEHEYREVCETGKMVVGSKDGMEYCIPERIFQCERCMRLEVSTDDLTTN